MSRSRAAAISRRSTWWAAADKLTNNGVDAFNPTARPAGGTTLDQRQRSIGIQLTFPIYSGGMVSSQVRQAVYQHRAAKERLERVARQTEHDARDAYLGVLSEISRVKALHRAVESNRDGAARHRIRLRSGNAHGGGCLAIAAAVGAGADRLCAQPLRLHAERDQAAAGGRHPVRAKLAANQRAAHGCACPGRRRPMSPPPAAKVQ